MCQPDSELGKNICHRPMSNESELVAWQSDRGTVNSTAKCKEIQWNQRETTEIE